MKYRLKRTDPRLIGSYWTGDLGARLRGLKHNLPQGEYAFYNVADEQLEGCLYYEKQRELQFLKGKEILVDGPVDDVEVVDVLFANVVAGEPGDDLEHCSAGCRGLDGRVPAVSWGNMSILMRR